MDRCSVKFLYKKYTRSIQVSDGCGGDYGGLRSEGNLELFNPVTTFRPLTYGESPPPYAIVRPAINVKPVEKS